VVLWLKTTFFSQGGKSLVFFCHSFLNLSLISRFPIYAHFGAK
jgi:hypothetical protein